DPAIVRLEVLHVRQHDRKVTLRYRHDAARVAIDDRDRRTPIALPRHAPVVQPEIQQRLGVAMLLEPTDDRALAILDAEPAELARVHEVRILRFRIRFLECRMLVAVLRVYVSRMRASGSDNAYDRKTKRFSKLEIAFVVAGHGHDRAGT